MVAPGSDERFGNPGGRPTSDPKDAQIDSQSGRSVCPKGVLDFEFRIILSRVTLNTRIIIEMRSGLMGIRTD